VARVSGAGLSERAFSVSHKLPTCGCMQRRLVRGSPSSQGRRHSRDQGAAQLSRGAVHASPSSTGMG